jgi:hypothetical protein
MIDIIRYIFMNDHRIMYRMRPQMIKMRTTYLKISYAFELCVKLSLYNLHIEDLITKLIIYRICAFI